MLDARVDTPSRSPKVDQKRLVPAGSPAGASCANNSVGPLECRRKLPFEIAKTCTSPCSRTASNYDSSRITPIGSCPASKSRGTNSRPIPPFAPITATCMVYYINTNYINRCCGHRMLYQLNDWLSAHILLEKMSEITAQR